MGKTRLHVGIGEEVGDSSQWGSWCSGDRNVDGKPPAFVCLVQGKFKRRVPFDEFGCGLETPSAMNHSRVRTADIIRRAHRTARAGRLFRC